MFALGIGLHCNEYPVNMLAGLPHRRGAGIKADEHWAKIKVIAGLHADLCSLSVMIAELPRTQVQPIGTAVGIGDMNAELGPTII